MFSSLDRLRLVSVYFEEGTARRNVVLLCYVT